MEEKNIKSKTVVKLVGRQHIPSDVKHTDIAGYSGKGKDVFGEAFIASKVGRYKVIDFHSVERFEGFFYGVPNTHRSMMHKMEFFTQGRMKPRAYKNDIIMICGKNIAMISSLPNNIKVRTLDMKWLTNYKMIPFICNSKPAEGLLHLIFHFNRTRQMTLVDVQEYIEMIIQKRLPFKEGQMFGGTNRASLATILRAIVILRESGIFSDAFPKLDLNEVVADPYCITTFSYFLLESDLERSVAMTVVAKLLTEEYLKNKSHPPLMIYFREIQTIYNKDSGSSFDSFQGLRDVVWWILTQGRDNKITLVANYQSASQIFPTVLRHFRQHFSFAQSRKDLEHYKNFSDVPDIVLDKLSRAERGRGAFFADGIFKYPVIVMPTRHMKKEAGFDVMKYLGQQYDYYDVDSSSLFGNENFENDEEEPLSSTTNSSSSKKRKAVIPGW